MTIDSGFNAYMPPQAAQIQPSERRSKIYYANIDSVPPEKRGKEISDEDYQRMSKQFVGAVKAPKASTIRKVKNEIGEWFTKFMEKPHKFSVDKIEQNTNFVLDIIDTNKKINNQTSDNSHRYDYRS